MEIFILKLTLLNIIRWLAAVSSLISRYEIIPKTENWLITKNILFKWRWLKKAMNVRNLFTMILAVLSLVFNSLFIA